MKQTTLTIKNQQRVLLPIVAVACLVIATMVLAGALFFFRGRAIMEQQLKDKLRSTAAAAAMQFHGETLDDIQTGDTLETSASLRETATKLHNIRENITNVKFAYIMRKTEDPDFLEFVADADLTRTDAELDLNENGTVDDDEVASVPGETYDWREWPELGIDAFLHPAVDAHIATDQWGAIISGYAPIRRSNGQVAGVLGIDMSANEFTRLSNSIFSPVALLLTLLAIISLSAGSALFVWKRRLESLRQLDNERSGLLRLAFHQLGGPLTMIRWSLEALAEEGPETIQKHIKNIQEGVNRLNSILQTLKSADIVQKRKIAYTAEFTSLISVVEQVMKDIQPKLLSRKQHVVLQLKNNIAMKLDLKLISGVLQELLTNAIDYSPDGAAITVRTQCRGKYAEVSVIDRGCGIPKNDLSRIFDQFTRGANANQFKTDGNGLGLYIVKGIVELAGGKISITSQEGVGTTVTVRLPMA